MLRSWDVSLSRAGQVRGASRNSQLLRSDYLDPWSCYTVPFRGRLSPAIHVGAKYGTTSVAMAASKGFMISLALAMQQPFRRSTGHAPIGPVTRPSGGMVIFATWSLQTATRMWWFILLAARSIGMEVAPSARWQPQTELSLECGLGRLTQSPNPSHPHARHSWPER